MLNYAQVYYAIVESYVMLDYESEKLSKEKKEERRAVECSSKER